MAPSGAADKPPEPSTPADNRPPSKPLEHLTGKQDKPQQQQQQQQQQQETKPQQQPQAAPKRKQQQPYEDIPNSQIRKIIAQRLLGSKQTVPHLYVRADADVDKLTELRATLKDQGIKVRHATVSCMPSTMKQSSSVVPAKAVLDLMPS